MTTLYICTVSRTRHDAIVTTHEKFEDADKAFAEGLASLSESDPGHVLLEVNGQPLKWQAVAGSSTSRKRVKIRRKIRR